MAQVLAVDDDQAIRETLRLMLEDAGHEVLEAEDGVAALRILRTRCTPMVVLLDLMMPRMNGIEVLATVANDPLLANSNAYISISASPQVQTASTVRQLCARLGIRSIAKPFDIDDVLDAVDLAARQLSTTLMSDTLDLREPSRAHG